MNILKYELKRNFKTFCFWMLGLSALIIYGMMEFKGIASSGHDMSQLMSSFPKIVLIIFGMNGLDVTNLIGYYGILMIYIFIMLGLYAISLGYNSTALEINQKTADFIYAKPISRVKITLLKQLGGIIYLFLFSLLSYVFVLLGIKLNDLSNNVNDLLILFTVALFLIGLIYYALGALLGAINHKNGSLMANLLLLVTYLLAILYDLIGSNNLLRYLTPIKYFEINRIITSNHLDYLFIILSLMIFIIGIVLSNYLIKKKNLS